MLLNKNKHIHRIHGWGKDRSVLFKQPPQTSLFRTGAHEMFSETTSHITQCSGQEPSACLMTVQEIGAFLFSLEVKITTNEQHEQHRLSSLEWTDPTSAPKPIKV